MLGGHSAERSAFLGVLDHELARDPSAVAIARIDLDRLTRIRQTFGSGVARAVAYTLMDRLESIVADPEHVLKYDEDAYILILRVADTDPDTLEGLGMHIIETLSHPIEISGQPPIAVGSNVGMSCAADFEEIDTLRLLTASEIAVQRADELGSRRVIVFESSTHEDPSRLPKLFADMLPAIVSGQFVPYFQPMVSLPDCRIVGAEALVRWDHPEHGLLAPGEFIPEAERSGLIRQIDASTALIACTLFSGFARERNLNLGINLSAADLDAPNLAEQFNALFERTGMSPSNLVVEVTETAMSQHWSRSQRRLESLKELGIRLAVDDFGSGHMFLDRLSTGLFDILKVDRSVVVAAGDAGARSTALLEGVVQLARGLDMHVVAEGIEEEAHLRSAIDAGFTRAQGFYFSKPVPGAEFAELVATRTTL